MVTLPIEQRKQRRSTHLNSIQFMLAYARSRKVTARNECSSWRMLLL
jgi:hypothetical protein